MKITTIILTKNEEINISYCLNSLKWCDDIHVVDSGSTDRTVELALDNGAKVKTHIFKSFGDQRNWALNNCKIKHEWVLFLDADERSTEKFRDNLIREIIKKEGLVVGFYCCPKTILNNTWLKRSDSFPKWQFRVLRKNLAHFEDSGHGQKENSGCGPIGYIKEPYLHIFMKKGWSDWWDKHNKYSSKEAEYRLNHSFNFSSEMFKGRLNRIRLLKLLVSKIPFWPILRFFIDYILKMGFLDGKAGLIYCINISFYEFLIQLKMQEIRNKK